jgi:competence protein ComEC
MMPAGSGGRHRGREVLATLVPVLVIAAFLSGCTMHPAGPDITASPFYGENGGGFEAHFIDVGQGDATLFLAGGKVLLVDAGDFDAGKQVAVYLKRQNVTRIDYLVATHPHADHIGGMEDVLDAFPVGQVLGSGIPHTGSTYEEFLKTVDRKKIPHRKVVRGDEIEWAPGAVLRVLSPPADPHEESINDESVVIQAGFGRIGFLLTGDAGFPVERELATLHVPLANQILKVSHHGSSDATGTAFLGRVLPDAAIISAKAGNEFGHPHSETLGRLAAAGVTVFRTDRDGTVVVRTDGMRYTVTLQITAPVKVPARAGNASAAELPAFDTEPFRGEAENFVRYAAGQVREAAGTIPGTS